MSGRLDHEDRNDFAQEMIAMRHQRGWNQEELAAKMIVSRSTVTNIESCYRAPTLAQAVAADEAFQTPGTFQRHEKRLRGIPFSAGFRPFQPHEEQARLIRTFEHTLVPGLFQTKEYAQAILAVHPEATEDVVKERAEARINRQTILAREHPAPPRMYALLDEQVLRRNVGGPAVMATQTERLVKLAHRPRISIQMLPADRPNPGLHGAFVIAETDQPPAIVYLENAYVGQVSEAPDTAEEMTALFDAIRTEALTGSASLAMIEEYAQQWNDQIEQ